jgi:hypothetical protein
LRSLRIVCECPSGNTATSPDSSATAPSDSHSTWQQPSMTMWKSVTCSASGITILDSSSEFGDSIAHGEVNAAVKNTDPHRRTVLSTSAVRPSQFFVQQEAGIPSLGSLEQVSRLRSTTIGIQAADSSIAGRVATAVTR